MSTERHVTSLALSRRLEEAGFPQECMFGWFQTRGGRWSVGYFCGNRVKDVIAAPLLSEIMEQMPGHVCVVGRSELSSPSVQWWAEHSKSVGSISGPTGPDAAAALWLALRGEK